jgi:hypothetical protein
MGRGITGRMPARGRTTLLALVTAAVAVAAAVGNSSAATSCDMVASASGSDAAAGNAASPFRTTQKLVDSLQAGETGCLRAGLYEENVAIESGGGAGAPITLSSYPGERATLRGRLRVKDSANHVVVESLDLDGRHAGGTLPSPSVYGDDVVFRDNDVSNYHTGICFLLGSNDYGHAQRVTIERNRIHDCGVLPAENHHHGIYVEHAADLRVLNNWIYDNADRGIQFYPDSQRAYVAGNVIDGNGQGVIFSRESAGNVVEHNVITNSVLRWNIEDWELTGTGNIARRNCVWSTRSDSYARGGGIKVDPAFAVAENLVADPLFVDRTAKDFRLRTGSPCAALLAGGGAPAPAPAAPAAPQPAPQPAPAQEPAPAPAADSPPVVEVTAPSSGAWFERRLRISAAATDDRKVSRVEFFVDGRLIDRDTSAPYRETWRVRGLKYGVHTVTAKAYDTAGQLDADAVSVRRVHDGKARARSKYSTKRAGKRAGKRKEPRG